MKVIDLLNKIANGEIEEDVMFEYSHGNGYKEYCTTRQFFDRYIVDKENLNLEIYEDKEKKKIDTLDLDWVEVFDFKEQAQQDCVKMVFNKINEIIDKINKEK